MVLSGGVGRVPAGSGTCGCLQRKAGGQMMGRAGGTSLLTNERVGCLLTAPGDVEEARQS